MGAPFFFSHTHTLLPPPQIRRDNPSAKSLVFSSWPDVLDIVASALQDNDIQHAALHAQGKFKRNLQKFKVLHYVPTGPLILKSVTNLRVKNVAF